MSGVPSSIRVSSTHLCVASVHQAGSEPCCSYITFLWAIEAAWPWCGRLPYRRETGRVHFYGRKRQLLPSPLGGFSMGRNLFSLVRAWPCSHGGSRKCEALPFLTIDAVVQQVDRGGDRRILSDMHVSILVVWGTPFRCQIYVTAYKIICYHR